jgi:hypothetical protein
MMWPFGKSTPRQSREEVRQEIIDGYANALEHGWSIGTLRSSRSLQHPKALIELVFVNRLREMRSGSQYDVLWAAAQMLPDFQDMTEEEEALLRMFSARIEGVLTSDSVSAHAKDTASAFALQQQLTERASTDRERWIRELNEHGLTRAGSRF